MQNPALYFLRSVRTCWRVSFAQVTCADWIRCSPIFPCPLVAPRLFDFGLERWKRKNASNLNTTGMRVICYSRRSDFLFKKTLFDFDTTYPRTPAALVETICHLRGIDFPCKSTLQFFRGNLPWKNTFSRMRMYFSKFN